MSQKLVLVDGSSYLFRAFHALPYLTNSKGDPTGAITGVINMLRKLPEQHETKHVCIIFDAKGKNFRHDMYPEYKANRKKMADELRVQIEPLHKIIKAMGFPLISIPDVEADDVIGTLSTHASSEGWKVVISTGDKDMAQLVNQNVTLIDTMKNKITDEAMVQERFGVTPDQIIDYLALMGDTSDNIPGVPKVGPKTASKWLNEFQTIKGVMDNADSMKGKVGENLRSSLGFLPLSYKLATIRCDVQFEYQLNELKMTPPDINYLRHEYEHYEFKNLLRQLDHMETQNDSSEIITATPSIDSHYEIILTDMQLSTWIASIETAKLFAIDTETTSIDPMKAKLVGISFAVKPGTAAYLPLTHDYEDAPKQLDFTKTLQRLKPLLENPNIHKIGQNIKYDLKVFARNGISLQGVVFDTMLESYVFDSAATRHNMDALAKKYLNYETTKFEEVAGKGKKQLTFNQVSIPVGGLYAAEDADITLRLHQYLWPKISDVDTLTSLFEKIEMPVMQVIDHIERTGVRINSDFLHAQSDALESQINILATQAYELAGEEFNLSSAKQLREILFEKLEIPALKKTPGGVPSTSEEVLKELAENYELPSILMEYRHLAKLKSTYTDKLPLMVNPETGRVHTSYHQAVAVTGRLSSSDPNLQNIPIRSETGRKIRQAFIPNEGYKMVAADYSQVELRIMAHLSQDASLLKAFTEGADIHTATAAETLGIAPEEVTTEQRRKAKAVNFGLIYGMSAFGLAKQLSISRSEAQTYVDIYFDRYPGVQQYMKINKAHAFAHGYVETIFGRRLYLPDIKARNMGIRRAAERVAINAPMQGSAADIIKRAMMDISHWISTETQDSVKMIMQVHDELVFEVKDAYVAQAISKIKSLMEGAAQLDIPLVVDVGIGDNWDEAH
jgi:DNA polymerase-1